MEIFYRSGRKTRPVGHTNQTFTERDVGATVKLMVTLKQDAGGPVSRELLVEVVDPIRNCIYVSRA